MKELEEAIERASIHHEPNFRKAAKKWLLSCCDHYDEPLLSAGFELGKALIKFQLVFEECTGLKEKDLDG